MKYVTDFKKILNFWIYFFLHYLTEKRLDTLKIFNNDIEKIYKT